MTRVEKSATDFFLDRVIGGRSAIRLITASCEWAKHITGKTNFVFLRCSFDTAALTRNCLKPLDSQIDIVKGVTNLFAFKEKCWNQLDTSSTLSILQATQHLFRTVGDAFGGIRCCATFGAVVLLPYVQAITLVKSGLGIPIALIEIASRVNNLIMRQSMQNNIQEKRLELMGDVAMIILQVFSIQLSFFGGYCALFKDHKVPEILFTFWKTGAAISGLTHSATEYMRSK